MKFNAEKGIVIGGHRGNTKLFPENTLPSFRSAIRCGVDMIETDIHMTSDGELVLMHDHDVKRTTGGEGLIQNMTFAELRKLNAGTESEFMPTPTLRELLALAEPAEGLLLNLEIKVYLEEEGAERVARAVDETIRLCEEYHMDKRVMLNSFDAYVLEYAYKKYGKRFILHGFYPFTLMKNVTVDPAEYLDYACYWEHGSKEKEFCDAMLAMGLAPCTGANTTEEMFWKAASLGCVMFTENDPQAALEYRSRLK